MAAASSPPDMARRAASCAGWLAGTEDETEEKDLKDFFSCTTCLSGDAFCRAVQVPQTVLKERSCASSCLSSPAAGE